MHDNNIKNVRKQRGLKQVQLAELTGIDQRQISRWEVGTHRPNIDALVRIAGALQCTLEELL